MRTMNALALGLLVLAWLPGNTAQAATDARHPLGDIRDRVVEFVEANHDAGAGHVQIEVGSLDPRLRLPACPTPLSAFLPPGRRLGGNVTIGVRCEAQRPWTIYVPARVKTFVEVAVIDRPVARGEAVDAADLRLEVRDVGGLRTGYYTRIEDATGMIARRSLSRGAPLSANMLARPTLVRRGERVTLVAGNAAIQVRTEGRALRDGTRGQLIAVRNVRSNRVIEGVVVSPGIVEVRL